MAKKEYLNPVTMFKSPRYAHVVKAGNTVYISGQVAIDREGRIVGRGSVEAQARQVWRNIEQALQAVGGTLRDLVKTNMYFVDKEHLRVLQRVRLEVLPWENRPTSTAVVVVALAHPDYLVEIEGIAVLDS